MVNRNKGGGGNLGELVIDMTRIIGGKATKIQQFSILFLVCPQNIEFEGFFPPILERGEKSHLPITKNLAGI